jgi:hypothetical protein
MVIMLFHTVYNPSLIIQVRNIFAQEAQSSGICVTVPKSMGPSRNPGLMYQRLAAGKVKISTAWRIMSGARKQGNQHNHRDNQPEIANKARGST